MSPTKNILITGGSGHIGRTLAAAFLADGCCVALIDRDAESLASAKAELLLETKDGQVVTITADLSSDDASEVIAGQLVDWKHLDVLIHGAAFVGTTNLSGWVVPFPEQSLQTWEAAVKVNLTSVFSITQRLYPLLLKAESPSVINISSIYGLVGPDYSLYDGIEGMGNPAAYAASKGGMNQLTRWMSASLAPHVRVNALSLGGIFRNQNEKFVERYIARVPLARMGTEEDITGPVKFLAGDDSRYVTGQILAVDGGYTAL